MQAVHVAKANRVISASSACLAQHGAPATPDDLQRHTIVAAGGDPQQVEWKLQPGATAHSVRLQPG